MLAIELPIFSFVSYGYGYGSPPRLLVQLLLAYGLGALICVNPLATAVMTETFLVDKHTVFYFTLPFTMPPDTESFSLVYRYERHHASEARLEHGSFTSRQEVNIIDLGLVAPDGAQVGASGADKSYILISETLATPGYRPSR